MELTAYPLLSSNIETQIYEQINITQAFMFPWQQICQIYPLKAHRFYLIYSVYHVYNAILLFHHFEYQVLEKKITSEKSALPWKLNCFLYQNNSGF